MWLYKEIFKKFYTSWYVIWSVDFFFMSMISSYQTQVICYVSQVPILKFWKYIDTVKSSIEAFVAVVDFMAVLFESHVD